MAPPSGDCDERDRRMRGTEVFVGGLPLSATETTLRQIFSTCGEILEVRIMKHQDGISKGYGFVRFSKSEFANTAIRKRNGFQLEGKRLDVDFSSDKDTVFFGNLEKGWSLEEFEELIRKEFKDVVSVDLAMASNSGSSNKRHLNRGFAFVTFSSHGAAARVIRVGSRDDFLLGGIVHPTINWADKQSDLNSDETTKMKAAFVGNLPANVNEEYLKKLFEQFGEVERVVISRKGQQPVGFVHFARRNELDNAIKEMDGKTVRGPDRGPYFRIQVSIARPAVDNDRKRTREEEKTRRPNMSRDRLDSSYERHGQGSHRQGKAPRLSNTVVEITDPYESAISSLPSAPKELLLRILRLGIGTRYDIDIRCIKSLNELPESSAVAVLKEFLISGGDKQNKGGYFASLIAKHHAPSIGLVQKFPDTYMPRNPEMYSKQPRHDDYDYMTSRNGRYRSPGHYNSSYYADDPPISETRIRRYAEKRPSPEPRLPQEIVDIRRYQEATLGHGTRQSNGKVRDHRYPREWYSKIERTPEEAILSRERRLTHGAGYNTDISPELFSRSSAENSAARQQVRFDPFTGEPYKFDPFTGEPIRPQPNERHSGSLY